MSRLLRSLCAPVLLCVCAAILIGCGGTIENRNITFSSDGKHVAFQHGRDGIYIANKDGSGLMKIYSPDKDAMALGTPLWAPNDGRVIFTTAHPAGTEKPTVTLPAFGDNPAPRAVPRVRSTYTCWLRDEAKGEAIPETHQLFTAEVEDVGYVAAGLAVRWHPKGDRVLFVQKVGDGHAVFEYDLTAKATRRVFPAEDTAKDVAFDWTPDGSHLVCVLADTPEPERQGIWIGRDGANWWHVANSSPLTAPGEHRLETLKAARPTFTQDGQRFAFVMTTPSGTQGKPDRHVLWQGALDGHKVMQLLEGYEPFRDLTWQPDGKRLGFIRGEAAGKLQIAQLDGTVTTVTTRPVRTFAGWDTTGKHLAYVSPDHNMLHRDEERYSLLFFPDPLARDALWVAPGDGKGEGQAVVSELRSTFTHWSPTDDKLSLWFTFSPTHPSLVSLISGGGLRPGDPAAVVETGTGKINWMTVDANEKIQVGHYHLMKRNYAEAWRWYEQADKDLAPKPDAPKEEPAVGGQFRDHAFFEYYCLKKLGRTDEANAKLATFRTAVAKWVEPQRPKNDAKPDDNAAAAAVFTSPALIGNFYAAEVFLSLDAAKDGTEFLRQELTDAKTDEDRFSAALVLSQVLLLQGDCDAYAAVVTETLAPLMLKTWKPEADLNAKLQERLVKQPFGIGTLAVMPLARPDLLAKVSSDRLPKLIESWKALHAKAPDELFALGSGLILEELYKRDRQPQEAAQVRQGLAKLLLKAELAWDLDGKAANDQMQTRQP